MPGNGIPLYNVPVEDIKNTAYIAIEIPPSGSLLFDSPIYYRMSPASDFCGKLIALGEEREILQHAVQNMWRVYRFNQHYIGNLAGGVSDEDFNSAVKRYVKEPIVFRMDELRNAAHIILPLIDDDEMTPNDLAVLLNADPNQLELALGAEQ
jgi:hypothetical protein